MPPIIYRFVFASRRRNVSLAACELRSSSIVNWKLRRMNSKIEFAAHALCSTAHCALAVQVEAGGLRVLLHWD